MAVVMMVTLVMVDMVDMVMVGLEVVAVRVLRVVTVVTVTVVVVVAVDQHIEFVAALFCQSSPCKDRTPFHRIPSLCTLYCSAVHPNVHFVACCNSMIFNVFVVIGVVCRDNSCVEWFQFLTPAKSQTDFCKRCRCHVFKQ